MTARVLFRAAVLAVCGIALSAALFTAPVSAQSEVPESQSDPWNFADEDEAAPTLVEHARQQALDIGLFVGFAALALTAFFRKSDRLTVATLIASVAYLGVYKSQLISIVNVFGLLTANLPVFSYSR